jgi:hypothetical protein
MGKVKRAMCYHFFSLSLLKQARYVLPLFLSEFTETFATWENRFKINVSGTWKPLVDALVDAYDASREDLFASNDKKVWTG